MSENDISAVLGLLASFKQDFANLQRDTSQIKTDLAVNTTKTGYIEEHLRTLNGKVIKQEAAQQKTDEKQSDLTRTVDGLVLAKRRRDDGWLGVLKQVAVFILGLLSAFIINKYFPH